MQTYNPITALSIFFSIAILLFVLFKPQNGWFWRLKKILSTKEKTIIEDILKQLYHFEKEGSNVTMKTLVQVLDFKNKNIVNAINNMTINHLIFFESDVLKLTPSGNEYALRIIRVHRLWERYLAEKTGFHKTEWHHRAEAMEHKLTDAETEALSLHLGNPKFDPHGDPIPSKFGEVIAINGTALSQLPMHTIGKITHIEDEPEIIYKQILAENIHIGSHIEIIENNATRVVFQSEGERFKLAPIVAANITVSAIAETTYIDKNTARLSSLKLNETATITGISKECRGDSRRRLLDLGFVKGAQIQIDLVNPLGDPNAYLIKGTSIALRKHQADKILIQKVS